MAFMHETINYGQAKSVKDTGRERILTRSSYQGETPGIINVTAKERERRETSKLSYVIVDLFRQQRAMHIERAAVEPGALLTHNRVQDIQGELNEKVHLNDKLSIAPIKKAASDTYNVYDDKKTTAWHVNYNGTNPIVGFFVNRFQYEIRDGIGDTLGYIWDLKGGAHARKRGLELAKTRNNIGSKTRIAA